METLSKDLVLLLNYLLPGFLAAGVFHGLTAHPRPSEFERVVQALMFTVVIQAVLSLSRVVLELVGQIFSLWPWDPRVENASSVMLALVTGGIAAYSMNSDVMHRWLRQRNCTTRTSHPSEWYGAFAQGERFVILHLRDNRRIMGWPRRWPASPRTGQFYIMYAIWLEKNGGFAELKNVDGVLISAEEVRWVEFLL